jgi:hypothetical protein
MSGLTLTTFSHRRHRQADKKNRVEIASTFHFTSMSVSMEINVYL